jgi:hypothetical protein
MFRTNTYPTGSRWELKELLAGDNDDLTRCPADLAPGDGLLPVGALDNYSLVFVIFINFFGQLKE